MKKVLPNISSYVIYAPSLFVRILGKIGGPIIRPDKIIKEPKEFEQYFKLYI